MVNITKKLALFMAFYASLNSIGFSKNIKANSRINSNIPISHLTQESSLLDKLNLKEINLTDKKSVDKFASYIINDSTKLEHKFFDEYTSKVFPGITIKDFNRDGNYDKKDILSFNIEGALSFKLEGYNLVQFFSNALGKIVSFTYNDQDELNLYLKNDKSNMLCRGIMTYDSFLLESYSSNLKNGAIINYNREGDFIEIFGNKGYSYITNINAIKEIKNDIKKQIENNIKSAANSLSRFFDNIYEIIPKKK